MKKYTKTLKQFTREGFISIIKESKTKSECLEKLRKYTERNSHTIRKWIKKYDLQNEYDKLYTPETNLIPGGYEKKLKQEELDYWQSLIDNSNSYREVFKKHKLTNNKFKERSVSVLYKYFKPNFPIKQSNRDGKTRLVENIMSAVSKQFRDLGIKNNKKFEEYLGIPREEFFIYIESHFKPFMTWENYGSVWVIQHIIPRAWVETYDDIYKLNFYKNLIPYEISPNSRLSDNIILSQLNDYHFNDKRMQKFLDKAWNEDRLYENTGYSNLQYMLEGITTNIKKVNNRFTNWKDWKLNRDISIKKSKEILSGVFNEIDFNNLRKF